MKGPNKNKSLYVFISVHILKNFKTYYNLKSIHFDVITVTETGIPKNVSLIQNIILNNYSFEHTPTNFSAGVCI